jgi:aryl-alcohol dehydrogenase-like predicted oxidoreductase
MRYRTFGRTGWQVSDVGYGMWGLAGWTGSDDEQSDRAIDQAIELGCNFFDTAWAYGDGRSEQILGRALKRHSGARLYVATKIPPKNRQWPTRSGHAIDDVFPADYIREYTERSLENIGVASLDLQQFHVWNDAWAEDERWQRAVRNLKEEGLVKSFGISVNRFQPTNVMKALDTGLIDAVQVVYNVLDQNPEDELFPRCQAENIAIIARVPFDEGSLTGTLTADSTWPQGDFRNGYFTPQNLRDTLPRIDALKRLVPAGMTLPELALRYILQHPAVTTVIPGMRKIENVRQNIATSDAAPLPDALMAELKRQRWNRSVDWE